MVKFRNINVIRSRISAFLHVIIFVIHWVSPCITLKELPVKATLQEYICCYVGLLRSIIIGFIEIRTEALSALITKRRG